MTTSNFSRRFPCPYRIFLIALALLLLLASALRAARASGDFQDRALNRRPWWPLSTGPFYGDLPERRMLDSDVIRLRVGSFQTRGPGLPIPDSLRITGEAARSMTAPWIVQLEGPITEAKKDALRAAGVHLYNYVPNNAFLVRAMSPEKLAGLPG